MIGLKTPLRRTVTLVENRIANKTSPDAWKDLTFLAEHYRSTQEWSKADATTRHMIAVAEGDTDSVLKLTPIDVERHLNKIEQTCRRQRWTLLDRMLLVALIIGLPYLAVATLIDNPQFLLDLRAQIFQFDPQTFVDRSSYFVSQNKLNEALRECEKALAIDPSNSKALQQKSYVLYLFGRYVESLQVNDSSKNKTTTFFWNRERALNALGDNYSAAEASFGAYSAGSSSDGLRKRWDSHKKHDIF